MERVLPVTGCGVPIAIRSFPFMTMTSGMNAVSGLCARPRSRRHGSAGHGLRKCLRPLGHGEQWPRINVYRYPVYIPKYKNST